jgi:N-acetylmuramoyl-L-alanine amidase
MSEYARRFADLSVLSHITDHIEGISAAAVIRRILRQAALRVVIDVGHTAMSPGADSTRGVPEYEFNLKLAGVIAQSLHKAGFDKTVRLVTRGPGWRVCSSVRRTLIV